MKQDERIKAVFLVASLVSPALAFAQDAGSAPDDDAPNSPVEEQVEEQARQIRDLQERLRELEDSTMSGQASGTSIPGGARNEEDASDSSNDRIDLGAVREANPILTRSELIDDDFPGSWPMFGSNLRMKVGGYLKSDFVFDFDGTTDKNQFLMRTIPVEGTPAYGNDGYFTAFAKESRFNFDIRRVEEGSPPLRAFLEGDFFSSGGQFRLRHAYITAGDFLVGQTWTTLSFLESMPYMIDFAAGDALFGGRTTQVRYTKEVNDSWTLAFGLENLDLLGIENSSGLPGQANLQYPLLAARADYRWDSGVLFLGSSVAQLSWDGGATGPSDTVVQTDVVVAGRQAFASSSYFTWNVAYGQATGENIMAFAGSDANAVLRADGKLESMPAFSTLLGLGHQWNSKWSSNFSYAYGWLDTPDSREPFALKRGGIGHVNLIWKPVQHFSAGVEFMHGTQRTQNDALGSASRLQFMVKYDF